MNECAGNRAPYRVTIEWAPAYELLVSVWAYLDRKQRKTLELGTSWDKHVRERLSPALVAELASVGEPKTWPVPDILVHVCPGPRDVAGFLSWLDGLSAGQLYEVLTPHVEDGTTVREVARARSRSVSLLAAWDEQYFRGVDAAILDGLAAHAATTRALAEAVPPLDVVEMATNGVVYRPRSEPTVVVLVPQHHFRPWNLFSRYRDLHVLEYPADAVAPSPGQPPPGLLRLTRALADENRLRILHFLAAAGSPCSFTDVVNHTRLAKSTVHHHMVALRAANLVRVHESGEGTAYSLRPRAVEELGARLGQFLFARP